MPVSRAGVKARLRTSWGCRDSQGGLYQLWLTSEELPIE
ncbi:MAG: hypothetical protein QOF79_2170 [Actinomycetota bacterium]|jgi:hypothetical protein|nr:hypothetical protein [Actinomycetota bacterium]